MQPRLAANIQAPGNLQLSMFKCENCGKTNRVPAAARGSPRCGNCHRPLPWIVAAGDGTFAEFAENAAIPVLVAVHRA